MTSASAVDINSLMIDLNEGYVRDFAEVFKLQENPDGSVTCTVQIQQMDNFVNTYFEMLVTGGTIPRFLIVGTSPYILYHPEAS